MIERLTSKGEIMRTITVSEILALARLRTDTVYSQAVTDSELLTLLAQHYRNLYNTMTTKDESLFMTEIPLTVVNGLADLPSDFFKTLSVFVRMGEFDYPLTRTGYQSRGYGKTAWDWPSWIMLRNQLKFTPATSPSGLYLAYLPLPLNIAAKATGMIGDGTLTPSIKFTAKYPGASGNLISVALTSGGTAGSELVSITDELVSVQIEDGVSTVAQVKSALDSSDATQQISVSSGVAGALSVGTVTLSGAVEELELVCSEDDYLISSLCVDIAKREESDYKPFEQDRQEALGNIITYLAPRDNGNPVKIRDVSRDRVQGPPFGWRR
jgi:hypothetical protein